MAFCICDNTITMSPGSYHNNSFNNQGGSILLSEGSFFSLAVTHGNTNSDILATS